MAKADSPETSPRGQPELPGGAPAAAEPGRMRELLHGLLAEARAAQRIPWPPVNAELYRVLFPELTFCLPEEEAAWLRREFAAELARLEAA
jgi:hypothetical protein